MNEASDTAKRAAQRLHEYGFFAGGSPVEQARNIIQSAIDEALAAQRSDLKETLATEIERAERLRRENTDLQLTKDAQAEELVRLKEEANRLVGYCLTCKNVNNSAWMRGFVRHLNMLAESLGDPERAAYNLLRGEIEVIHPTPEDAHESTRPE